MRWLLPILLSACSAGVPLVDAADAGADAGSVEDAGGVDAGPVSDVVEASRYCEESAPFFCRFYLRCGRLAAADQAECERVFAESCEAKYAPKYEALARQDLVSLSASGIEACRRHLEAVACEAQVLDLDGPCAGMWIGASPSGAPCGLDVESFVCAPGLRCQLDLSFCGRCVPEAADGELCDANHSCRPGSTCVSNRCEPRGRPGDACDASGDCVIAVSCEEGVCVAPVRSAENAACGSGARCPYRTACVGGTCRRQALLGEACDEAGCASGFCSAGTCVALLAPGAACSKGAQCTSGICAGGACETIPGRCFR